MYAADHSVYVEETALSTGLCGVSRPWHFRGVTTVVAKLFNVVQPHVAVFGQKDAQQARVIEQMVRDLNFPVEIVVAPIVREPDGLAMSSRNAYLTETERKQAACLYGALCLAEDLYREGVRDAGLIREHLRSYLESFEAAELEYIEIVSYESLAPVDVVDREALVALCARIGTTRLIDNTILGAAG
jgi:pantoate--beta-alanine ligase